MKNKNYTILNGLKPVSWGFDKVTLPVIMSNKKLICHLSGRAYKVGLTFNLSEKNEEYTILIQDCFSYYVKKKDLEAILN